MEPSATRFTLWAVFFVSAAILSFETLLPRLFAVYSGGNLTFFCVSLALLGMASGGVAVFIWEGRFDSNIQFKLSMAATAFALTVVAAAGLTALVGGFSNSLIDEQYASILGHPESASYDALTLSALRPALYFVFLAGAVNAIPFFFGGICIALALKAYSKSVGRVYGFDLLGAALGGVATVVGLALSSLSNAIVAVACLATIGALLFLLPDRRDQKRPIRAVTIVAGLLALLYAYGTAKGEVFDFSVHRYAFGRSLHEGPLTELSSRWSPLGRIGLFERDWSPPNNVNPRVRQKTFVGMDLGGHSIIEPFSDANLLRIKHTSKYDDDVIEPIVVPGLYRSPKNYLVLMAGNGQEMLRLYGWYGDAIDIEGVEISPWVVRFGLGHEPANLAEFFSKPSVSMIVAEGRHYVETGSKIYDAIVLSYSGATFASGTGSFASTPQFLFTKEAFKSYLERLSPTGVIVSPDSSRVRELFRIFGTALTELDSSAIPRNHVITYRNRNKFNAELAIFHREPIGESEIAEIRRGLDQNDLELECSPFTDCTDSILFDVLPGEHARAGAFTTPYTDNHPFFYFVGRSTKARVAVGSLVATLIVSGLLALGFLFMPFALTRRRAGFDRPLWSHSVAFALLGAGFMFLEVGAIQRLELFLGYPTLTLVVILLALLVGTGAGSFLSTTVFERWGVTPSVICLSICAYGVVLLVFLNRWLYELITVPLAGRIAIITVLLVVFGVGLGTLFPYYLCAVSVSSSTRLIAWAWAINGAFSVVSSNLGSLIYLSAGANAVIFSGLFCYGSLGLMDWSASRKSASVG